MKKLLLYTLSLLLPLSAFGGIYQADFWSWTTSSHGSSAGQKLTWKLSEDQVNSLPDDSYKGYSPQSLSKTAQQNIQKYIARQLDIYKRHTGISYSTEDFLLEAFGAKQLYFDDRAATPWAPTGKWIRFATYSPGPSAISIKIYLLSDDTVLEPLVEAINEER